MASKEKEMPHGKGMPKEMPHKKGMPHKEMPMSKSSPTKKKAC